MFNLLQKLPILIISLSLVFSCKHNTPRMEGPQLEFDKQLELQGASEDFVQGWNDGCEVGSDSASKPFYKTFTRVNKVDGWKMKESVDYRVAWTNAYWFCYRDDYVDHKSTGFGSFFRGWQ